MSNVSRSLPRRTLFRVALAGAATAATGAVLAACGGEAAPTAAPTIAATVARPTTPATTGAAAGGSTPAAMTGAASTVPATPAATAAPAGGATSATVAPAASVPTTAAGATTVDGKFPSPNPELGVPDAFTKLPPKFQSVMGKVGNGSKVSAYVINYDPPIPPRESNKYWQELEKRLGVTYDVIQSPAATYPEKTAALIAGGDLPDLMFLDTAGAPDLNKVIVQGAFADLTPYLSGDGLKEFPNLAAFAPVLWKNAAVNKKIYGVPRPRFLANNAFNFRQDWAEKVGFATQKNADDVFNMFVAMSKKDPDGNGKEDTYGISSSSPRPSFGLDILKGMFRAPNEWRLNADGTLLHEIETDEYKQSVEFARRLWAAGAYHPDAANLSTNQNKDLMAGGKIGGYSDGQAGLMGAGVRGRTKMTNPNALVTGWAPPGFDGGKPVFNKYIGFFGFTAISAKAGKDKERVKELLRILNYMAAPFGSEENIFLSKGIEGIHYTLQNGNPILNDTGKGEIGVNSGTQGVITGLTNPPPVAYYDPASDGPEMQKIQATLLANGIDNPRWGYYSPTFPQKWAELEQLNADRRIAIITGRDAISTYDAWVKDWRSRGGDIIRKEFQDAIKG